MKSIKDLLLASRQRKVIASTAPREVSELTEVSAFHVPLAIIETATVKHVSAVRIIKQLLILAPFPLSNVMSIALVRYPLMENVFLNVQMEAIQIRTAFIVRHAQQANTFLLM